MFQCPFWLLQSLQCAEMPYAPDQHPEMRFAFPAEREQPVPSKRFRLTRERRHVQ